MAVVVVVVVGVVVVVVVVVVATMMMMMKMMLVMVMMMMVMMMMMMMTTVVMVMLAMLVMATMIKEMILHIFVIFAAISFTLVGIVWLLHHITNMILIRLLLLLLLLLLPICIFIRILFIRTIVTGHCNHMCNKRVLPFALSVRATQRYDLTPDPTLSIKWPLNVGCLYRYTMTSVC